MYNVLLEHITWRTCLNGHKATCFSQHYKNFMQQNAHVLCPALIHYVIHPSDSSIIPKNCPNGRPLKLCCPRDNLNIKIPVYAP